MLIFFKKMATCVTCSWYCKIVLERYKNSGDMCDNMCGKMCHKICL